MGLNEELNYTAAYSDDVDKIRELVGKGADLASADGSLDGRRTPFHQACFHGKIAPLHPLPGRLLVTSC